MPPRLVGLLLGVLGTGALVEGGGIALAVLAEAAGDPAAELLYEGVAPTRDGLRRIVETRADSLRRAERPRAHRDLGMVELLEAERLEDEAEAAEVAASAEARFLAALSLAPADVVGWSMVPFAALRRGEVDRAVALVAAGARVVPHTPDYALNRVAVLLTADLARDDGALTLLERELAVAAGRDVAATARLVRERGREDLALAGLAGDPELAGRLARALEDLEDRPETR